MVFIRDVASPCLDIHAIERACGLTFSENHYFFLYEVAGEYIFHRELSSKIQDDEKKTNKSEMTSVVNAIDILCNVLHLHQNECVDRKSFEYIRPHPDYSGIHSVIASYLTRWKDKILKSQEYLSKPGRPKDHALRLLVPPLHGIYRDAGGKGSGCYVGSATSRKPGQYVGAFHSLVMEFLGQVTPKTERIAPENIGKIIVEEYKGIKKQEEKSVHDSHVESPATVSNSPDT